MYIIGARLPQFFHVYIFPLISNKNGELKQSDQGNY